MVEDFQKSSQAILIQSYSSKQLYCAPDCLKINLSPGRVAQLVGMLCCLDTTGSWVWFPVRAHMGGNRSVFLSHISVSLFLSLLSLSLFSPSLSQINKTYSQVRIKNLTSLFAIETLISIVVTMKKSYSDGHVKSFFDHSYCVKNHGDYFLSNGSWGHFLGSLPPQDWSSSYVFLLTVVTGCYLVMRGIPWSH